MIHLSGVRKAYRDGATRNEVLEGVDLHVEEGEFLAIVGPSGSGKSTLLNIVGGLDTDYEGDVEVAGRRLRGLSDAALSDFRGRTVSFVFQSFNLLAPLTALENVLLPAWFSSARDEAEARSRGLEALGRVRLADKADRRPERLSGGERQRVAIARALSVRPRVLLCDEPTGNLDRTTGAEVIDLFAELNAAGLTLVMVTHEARISERASRVLRLHEGRLVPGERGEGAR